MRVADSISSYSRKNILLSDRFSGSVLPLENIGVWTDVLTKKGTDVFTRLKICTDVYLCTDVFYGIDGTFSEYPRGAYAFSHRKWAWRV
jgi:hypothetical protein